ncbi:YihY/virulence factor BrkB family protein [Aquimarina sp. 2201CG5-10]|uniref:YihY/virulence factor BrkB family protein n=1 Tax=Aquimarina callyspongiae TaxID=3098150 RepID=UPI002AB597CA|nr:YihY/virulence factor BrkB family protein [Aquimarina sp. 2201CG5-10]MDY8135385.1 YihY/virulence factor BrkB family protein [Aquimarina sp. 2201CG5-10]
MIKFLKEVFNHFFNSNTFQKGASLAYYAVFSILPMIIIITSFLGIFFGKHAVSGEIYLQLKDILGNEASLQIQNLIKNQQINHNSVITTIIGFITLGFGASGMFNQIHNSFNSIWNIKAKPKNSILKYFSKHLASFLILILSFFIILISTTINSFLIKHAKNLHHDYKLLYVYEHFLSFVVMSIVFAIMFKFLGDAKVHWKVGLTGGLITSLLFLIGKTLIGLYIGHSHVSSTFGSASVLALLMLWIYYTSQIIFLGASFIKIISKKLGYEISPNSNAVRIDNIEIND